MAVRSKKGEGSIIEMKNGTFRAELKYTDQYGEKQKFQKTEPTRAKAQKTLEKFRRDLKRAQKRRPKMWGAIV